MTSPAPHPAKVGIDLFGCNRSKVTGWERYAINLAQFTAKELASQVAADLEICDVTAAATRGGSLEHLARGLGHFAVGAPRKARSLELDLYHAPTFPPGFVPATSKVVWTVHDDLILGGHAEYARRASALWVPLARARLGRVDRFVTFTDTVRNELLALGIDDDRISIVRPASAQLPAPSSAPALVDASGAAQPMPEVFVLVVGTLEERKNPALAASIARAAGLPVVFVGGSSGVAEASLGEGCLFAGRCSDQELAWCYANAAALLTASSYEGVNLPLFEALGLGLPVAASAIDVHVELAGHSVSLFDPSSVTEGAQALGAAVAKGRVAPLQLLDSWEQAARNYLDLYRSVLG